MKNSPSSSRIYDGDGYRQRGAAICVKDDKEEEVLLVTSKKDMDKWVVPGGGVECGEDESTAAVREVIEEAGVKGCIVRQLGVFENEQGKHRTAVYVLRVSEELHDWEDARRVGRRRRWFPVNEARVLLGLHKQSQQTYLDFLKSQSPNASPPTTMTTSPCCTHNSAQHCERLVNAGDGKKTGSTDNEHLVTNSYSCCEER